MSLQSNKPFNNLFQHAYVTNDRERAKAQFEEYGVANFFEMRSIEVNPVGRPPLTISVALAYYGSLQIEIIQPEGGACEIYRNGLPEHGFGVRLHHHGFLMYDLHEFEALRDAYIARGTAIAMKGSSPRTGNHYFYADTLGELGHYLEYIYLSEQGKTIYAGVPQNRPAG